MQKQGYVTQRLRQILLAEARRHQRHIHLATRQVAQQLALLAQRFCPAVVVQLLSLQRHAPGEFEQLRCARLVPGDLLQPGYALVTGWQWQLDQLTA